MRSTFSVLTLNLRFGLADDGPQSWRHRRSVLGRFLSGHIGDFMAFQEANDFQIEFLSACLPHHRHVGQRRPSPDFWQNNVIFYRPPWQLAQAEHFFLSPTPDLPSRFRESRWPRQCTLARFSDGAHEIVCGTTHLDFTDAVQVASAAIILKRIDRMAGGRPVVLSGDFNCSPHSACHALFTRPDKGDGAGFRNALAPAFPGTFHGFEGGPGRHCIDWILYRGAILKEQACVLPFETGPVYPSDHYAVAARFAWPP